MRHFACNPGSLAGAFAERFEEADGVGFAGELADIGLVGPTEGGYLGVSGQVASGDVAAENQGDDAAGHVLVDAGKYVTRRTRAEVATGDDTLIEAQRQGQVITTGLD